MQVQSEVQARYQAALASVAARLEEDFYVLAAVIYGSMARGEAWERSDLDMVVILKDGQERETRQAWLVEDDINVSASLLTRRQFKRWLEGELQGSMGHSISSHSRLLFTKDESIARWLEDSSSAVGQHDQALQLLRTAAELPWMLDKATKWLRIKRDWNYCCLWLLMAVNTLARVEVVLNGQAPNREALDQALAYNPAFFQAAYVDLINGPKTEATMHAALALVEQYIDQHAARLFQPVLDYLAHADGPVTARELDAHFKKKVQSESLGLVYEWLWRKGMVQKLTAPLRLTRRSTITLDEPAYYCDTDDVSDWE